MQYSLLNDKEKRQKKGSGGRGWRATRRKEKKEKTPLSPKRNGQFINASATKGAFSGSVVKSPPAKAGNGGSAPGLGRRAWHPTAGLVPGESQGPRSLEATSRGSQSPTVFGYLVKVTAFGLLQHFSNNFSGDSSPLGKVTPACVSRGLLSHRRTGSHVTPQLSGQSVSLVSVAVARGRRELLSCRDAYDSPVTTYKHLVPPDDCSLKKSHTSSFSLRCLHRGPSHPVRLRQAFSAKTPRGAAPLPSAVSVSGTPGAETRKCGPEAPQGRMPGPLVSLTLPRLSERLTCGPRRSLPGKPAGQGLHGGAHWLAPDPHCRLSLRPWGPPPCSPAWDPHSNPTGTPAGDNGPGDA